MTLKRLFSADVRYANTLGFTLNNVTASPRTVTPLDLNSACTNLVVEWGGSEPAPPLQSLACFVLTDFFALLHRTGLYNRQRQLFDGLSKIAKIEISQKQSGWFQKEDLPEYEINFVDARDKVVLIALYIDDETSTDKPQYNDRDLKLLIKDFLQRSEKIKGSQGSLTGTIVCLKSPFPESVLNVVRKLTNAQDPIGRYESLAPPPLLVPIDLLELCPDESAESASLAKQCKLRMIHPDVAGKQRPMSPTAKSPKYQTDPAENSTDIG